MSTGRRARVAGTLAAGLAFALIATGCTSSNNDDGVQLEGNESCSEFGAALQSTSTDIVNAFALLDTNSAGALVELRKARSSFAEAREGWAPDVDADASEFDDALGALIDATEKAADGEAIDAAAIQDAVATYEESAITVSKTCQEVMETSSE